MCPLCFFSSTSHRSFSFSCHPVLGTHTSFHSYFFQIWSDRPIPNESTHVDVLSTRLCIVHISCCWYGREENRSICTETRLGQTSVWSELLWSHVNNQAYNEIGMGETCDWTITTTGDSSGSESVALCNRGKMNALTINRKTSPLDFRRNESVSRSWWENSIISTRSEYETNVDLSWTKCFTGRKRERKGLRREERHGDA